MDGSNNQVQLSLASQQSKEIVQYNTERFLNFFAQLWNSPHGVQLQTLFKELSDSVREGALQFRHNTARLIDSPKEVFENILSILKQECTRQHVYSACVGLVVGGLIGFYFGIHLQKPTPVVRHMKAVVCHSYYGRNNLALVDDAAVPTITQVDEVLVQVKSSAVDNIDIDICTGYGKYIRKCLAQYYYNKKTIFPIILGRSCSGIITDIGCNVGTVDVGDEVWVSAPWWCGGTLSEFVLTRECFVSRKPNKLSFEGAASLAYSGCLAMDCLRRASIQNADDAKDKRILIESCCTPVGCVLTQLLKVWGADLTTSCTSRAAPVAKAMGSNDNILLSTTEEVSDPSIESKLLLKELEMRGLTFDIIFLTGDRRVKSKELQRYSTNGIVISSLPQYHSFQNCGALIEWIICLFIRIYYRIQYSFVSPSGNEHEILLQLRGIVDDGHLQSVVDHIYPPQEIELAVAHKLSSESIGNTIVKFS